MSNARKISAEVSSVMKHSNEVCTLTLRPREPLPNFRPGQFLHLSLDPYDPTKQWPESRVFSIASSPLRPSALKITLSVKGNFTRRMFDEIREGTVVYLKLPYGEVSFQINGRIKVLIAGGTGITPFVSFLEYLLDVDVRTPVMLFYGVRSRDLIIYDELLAECSRKFELFTKMVFVEDILESNPEYHRGRLDIETIFKSVNDVQGSDFYLSGPPPMIKSFEAYLMAQSVMREHIFTDQWE
jgi:ferredoxin-NADP reductase